MKMKNLAFILIPIIVVCSKSSTDLITGSGVLEGTEIIVGSKANGQILTVDVKEGDAIEQNTVIAKIDSEKLVLTKEQVLAGLEEANFLIKNSAEAIVLAQENFSNIKKRHQRVSALFNNGSATQQQMDDMETQYKNVEISLAATRNNHQAAKMKKKQIESRLKLIESQLRDCVLTSPGSGIVTEKYMEVGEMIAVGMPVISIADLTNLWIKLYVSELNLGKVKLGDGAEIIIDSYPDRKFKGKVIWISTKAEFTPRNVQTKEERTDLVYAVKIAVPNSENILKIGMPADILLKD